MTSKDLSQRYGLEKKGEKKKVYSICMYGKIFIRNLMEFSVQTRRGMGPEESIDISPNRTLFSGPMVYKWSSLIFHNLHCSVRILEN